MIVEVHTVKKEMKEDLLATGEMIENLHQDLKKEMIVEVHTVKKVANLLSLKKILRVLKKKLLKNLLRNLDFNSNNLSS